MKQAILLLSVAALAISCKKATPISSSDEAKKKEEAIQKNVLATYKLIEVSGGFGPVLAGSALGYNMTITCYRDQTFKKEKQTVYSKVSLTGAYKDSVVSNQKMLVLSYIDVPRSTEYDSLLDWVINNREYLLYSNDAASLTSGSSALDGAVYKYTKQ